MKTNLVPRHFSKVGESYVLWFEDSNRYIVVSENLRHILGVYFASHSKYDFSNQLQSNFDTSLQQAENYFSEITELLINSSLSSEHEIRNLIYPLIPENSLEGNYSLGNITFKIHFGSEQIKALIHPQWLHATSCQIGQIAKNFHIFKEEHFVYLFRGLIFVGRYAVSDYHLLQGKFALELINTLYHKTESDWIATFHASTVCNDKEAIMLIGDSGNGKSTLSAILMANGIDVLADDFTPLSAKNKELYRFPSGISVKPGAFNMLRPLFPDFDNYPVFKSTSKNVNVKYIPPIKGMDEGPSHLPCKKIVYIKYEKNTASTIQNIGIEKILETLIPESWISPLAQNSKLFLEWLKELECFELNYSDNDFAVSSIKKLFDS